MTAVAVNQVNDTCRADWDRYVGGHQSSEAYHCYAWRHVLEGAFGHACYYLHAHREDGTSCGVLPLAHLNSRLFGNFLVSIPGFNYCGLLADGDDSRAALLDEARGLAQRLGAEHLELRHRDTIHLDMPLREDKVAMILELPKDSDTLWKKFKPKLRSQIRKPMKEGAFHRSGGIEKLDDFYRVFARNMRDLGTPVYPKSLFAEMCRQFPDTVELHVVYVSDQPVAAAITVAHRDMTEIPFASSLREFNRASVNMLLYWSVIQAAIGRGSAIFDFGRSTPDTGTFRFKAQWGAEPQQLRWHYWLRDGDKLPMLNPQNPKFKLATRIWSHLPVPVANFFGPRIVRNLP